MRPFRERLLVETNDFRFGVVSAGDEVPGICVQRRSCSRAMCFAGRVGYGQREIALRREEKTVASRVGLRPFGQQSLHAFLRRRRTNPRLQSEALRRIQQLMVWYLDVRPSVKFLLPSRVTAIDGG